MTGSDALNAQARKRTWTAASVLLPLSAGFIALRTGRDALYMQQGGLMALPRAYVVVALLSIPQAWLVLRLLRKLGPRTTRLGLLGAAALIGVGYVLFAVPGASLRMTVLFFLVPLVFAVAFSSTWLLGTELLGSLPERLVVRGFSRLGGASIVGAIIGSGLARVAGPWLGVRGVLTIGTALVGLAWVALLVAHRRYAASPETAPPSSHALSQPPPSPARDPIVRRLAIVAAAGAVVGLLVDFQFFVGSVGNDSGEATVYFANVYLLLSLVSLLLQLWVTPWLRLHMGASKVLMAMPLAVAAGSVMALALAGGLGCSMVRVIEGGMKAGVQRTTWEHAFRQLPARLRAGAKVVVDGLSARLAEGATAIALWAVLRFASRGHGEAELKAAWIAEVISAWLALALVAAALGWVALSWWLTRGQARGAAVDSAAADGVGPAMAPPPYFCEATATLGVKEARRIAVPCPNDAVANSAVANNAVPNNDG